ncbi:hypothetical protein OBBRIDRAFT_797886 [Obba rivulosa]|uniref:Uncharacterized protein n=1 Tax=Obba rivulosa TaxID=1052685 RepID=A0A8E2DG97_9APHY|nr:hypothetical protein OBBRIDRAFT_797886 [Obba rivulosa]
MSPSSLHRRSGTDTSPTASKISPGDDIEQSGQPGAQGGGGSSGPPNKSSDSSTSNSAVIPVVVVVLLFIGTTLFILWIRRMLRRSRQRSLLRQARLASLNAKPQLWDINLDSAALRSREDLKWKNMTPVAVDFIRDFQISQGLVQPPAAMKLRDDPRRAHDTSSGWRGGLGRSQRHANTEDVRVRIAVAIAMPSRRGRGSVKGKTVAPNEESAQVCLGLAEARWIVSASPKGE